MKFQKIGTGDFGTIYEGLCGEEAIEFILKNEEGEMRAAFIHPYIAFPIDVVFGKTGEDGYGLAHIKEKHPEVLLKLSRMIESGDVVNQGKDRKLIITEEGSKKDIVVIKLDWNGRSKTWIVSAFSKL